MVDPGVDPQTGLIYLRARYYDPQTAQFLTRDPLEALTRQPYAYANDNPINFSDPSGLWLGIGWLPSPGDVVGAVGSTASTIMKYSPPGLALQAASSLTGATIGGCVGGSFSAGGSVSAQLCYLATPNGDSGYTATVGGGAGGPLSASASIGPVVSNGQSLNDQGGPFKYGGASAGYGPLSGGGSGAVGQNACGQTIWDAGLAWTPNIGLGPPVSIQGGESYTWTAPSWF